MGLFDSTEEHPPAKLRRYIITAIASAVIAFLLLWYWPGDLRFYKEKRTVEHFFSELSVGNFQGAYAIWKPGPNYSYKDFVEDWGPEGYYGPVKSYRIEGVQHLRDGSGVVITVDVSPFQPFPDSHDEIKQSKTKNVSLWVEFKDQSMSYPPY
ncbi:MAG TPA: hypothetical protein VMH00_08625 [Candidatus Limnocylindrales bacterium]|nr:hypothetical protein [Candidatus Limnocylindrales bacterium]